MRARFLSSLLTLAAASAGLVATSSVARADTNDAPSAGEPREIGVGMYFVATEDVNLRDAALSKGARIHVTRVGLQKGRVATVDVELADGYVLKRVAVDAIRKAFVLADESRD
ncbi:hypothetical protein [Polyangium sorediatum]|uniref:Uncharacterized protein n=1 Tax=Polyangium sorediatum TaxID=889274 RepID=A0ABT6NIF4_9BACT|nr:hypothetical protein [Polyangium sorediatum]MDI1428095.1 hypothetical protein [Polyangium sorediatum]